jgi:hypothetical protein
MTRIRIALVSLLTVVCLALTVVPGHSTTVRHVTASSITTDGVIHCC